MKKLLLVTAVSVALSACATGPAKNEVVNEVETVDTVIDNTPVAMMISGAGVGAGYYMDKQQKEMEEVLEAELAREYLQLQRLEGEIIKIDLAGKSSFSIGSVSLKSSFKTTLDKLAVILEDSPQTIIHIIGHTDSDGATSDNLMLSEKRAKSVANYFAKHGIAEGRLLTVGRGEAEPRATNETSAGRQLNRRVEIYVKPVIEGQESEALETPQPAE